MWSHYDSNMRIQEINNLYEARRRSAERRAEWNSYFFNTINASTNHVPENLYVSPSSSDQNDTQDKSRTTDNQNHNREQMFYVRPSPPAAGLLCMYSVQG